MSAVLRQIVWAACFSFLLALFLLIGFLFAFPQIEWQDLWNQDLMDIPIGIFIPAFSIVIGMIFGFISGSYWRNQFVAVDNTLHLLEEGRHSEVKKEASFSEVQSI